MSTPPPALAPATGRRGAARLLATVLLLAGAVGIAAPAAAHSALTDANPGPGDTVAPGSEVAALTFDRRLDPEASRSVQLEGPDGAALRVGAARVVDGTTLCVRTEELPAGDLTLTYRARSADGHLVQGQYAFRVAADGTAVTPGPCADAELSAPDEATDSSGADTGVPGWLVPVAAGIVVVTAALAGGAVWRSRRA